ncbi:MAG: hypothetical protein FJY85_23540 [Deltaproteobacteria bacterium]|nr:hypothetical protein [Deltaproteobacteria bacterium]
MLLRAQHESTVYVIENGRRRAFPDEATFRFYGKRFEGVRVIAESELNQIPEGTPIPRVPNSASRPATPPTQSQDPLRDLLYPSTAPQPPHLPLSGYRDGVLLRAQNQSTVYVIENGRRRAFPDEATFRFYGHRFEEVRVITESELKQIPEGEPIARVSSGARK